MSISLRSTSRFLISDPILTAGGEPTFGIMKRFRFLDRNNLDNNQINTFVVGVDTAGRPDRLAEVIYNDNALHWILIIFNRVDNPFNWPLNGQVIEYPIPSIVSAEI